MRGVIRLAPNLFDAGLGKSYFPRMPKDFSFNGAAPIAAEDQKFILDLLTSFGVHESLKDESILLTGGTGFFGKWLSQSFLAMNDQLGTNLHLSLVTRDRARTLATSPWLAKRADVTLIESDIRGISLQRPCSTVIHGAAAASQSLNDNQPEVMFDTIVEGTRQVLKVAKESGCRRFQLISSGGIYGTQPTDISHVAESYLGAPDPLNAKSAYGEAKRAAEFLAANEARREGFHLSVTRCFAFIGPYLPMDTHFAAGNFLKNILEDEVIQIQGDGSPLRSYLYAADLVVWLLAILTKGTNGVAYNVGSEQAFSIADLAATIHAAGTEVFPSRPLRQEGFTIAKPRTSALPARYVPATARARTELKLEAWTSLQAAAAKTLRWHDANRTDEKR